MDKPKYLGDIRPHPGQTVWEIKEALIKHIDEIIKNDQLEHLKRSKFKVFAYMQIVPAEMQTLPDIHHKNLIPEGHVRIGAVESVTHKRKIVWNDGCTYIVAINKYNVLKKYLKTKLDGISVSQSDQKTV